MDEFLFFFKWYCVMFVFCDLVLFLDLFIVVFVVYVLVKGFNDFFVFFCYEIVFVFGQLLYLVFILVLMVVFSDFKEVSMVCYEVVEVFGSFGEEDGVEEILKCFLYDEEKVVWESVIVVLDMVEYEKGGEVEYVLILEVVGVVV